MHTIQFVESQDGGGGAAGIPVRNGLGRVGGILFDREIWHTLGAKSLAPSSSTRATRGEKAFQAVLASCFLWLSEIFASCLS